MALFSRERYVLIKNMHRQKLVWLAFILLSSLFVVVQAVQAETDFTAVATDADGRTYLQSDAVQDVFVYDTTEDSDEGAWRKDLAAQQTSWYTETCAVTPCDRGTGAEFPRFAYLVLTDSSLDIIDAETQKLWMRFRAESANILFPDTLRAVTALDGRVFVASSGRLVEINFIDDTASYIDATDRYVLVEDILMRNRTVTWNATSGNALASNDCYDVSVVAGGGSRFVAVATASGVSVVNQSSNVIYDYYDTATSDDTSHVVLLPDGTLYLLNTTTAALNVFYDVFNDAGDQSAPDAVYSSTSTPALQQNPGVSTNALAASENSSTVDSTRNTLYFGSSAGVSILQEAANPNESNGSVKYLTTTYVTEEMVGDVRGTWTFEEDAGNFIDKSGGLNDLVDNGGVTRDVSAVRGEGVTLTAGSTVYLSQAYDADFDFGTGNFTLTGWFRHPDTSGGQVKLIDRTDGIGIGFQLYLDTAGNLVGRVSDDGSNWDTATSSGTVDDDTWRQFGLVWEPGAALTLFVNGLEAGSDIGLLTVGSISGTTPTLEIGRDNGGGEYYDGDLDEWMLTAEAQTAQQIWDMYSKGAGGLASPYLNTLAGNSNAVEGLSVTSDGRILWVGTNAAGGGVGAFKIGLVGDFAAVSTIDTESADSTFITYNSTSTPALVANTVNTVSAAHAAGREFLVAGTAAGATGLIQGVDWYVASNSYTHGGVLGLLGPCKVSVNYQICDSLGQIATGALSSTNYRLFDGYQYDDRDVVDGPPLLISSPTTDLTPFWQWQGVYDRSGVEGYYIRVGYNLETDDVIADHWLGNINHWEQDVPLPGPGTYYVQLKVRDKVGNEGNWGQAAIVVLQASMTFIIEGVAQGTTNLGSGTVSQESTQVSSYSSVIDFGSLSPNESKVAAQKLTVDMNVGEGYVVTVRQDGPMRERSAGRDLISSLAASNDEPQYWTAPALAHLGYHTDDVTLNNVGNGMRRFQGLENLYAGLILAPEEVMYSDTVANQDSHYVLYKIQSTPILSPGSYSNRVIYVATATF